MPYINQAARVDIDLRLDPLLEEAVSSLDLGNAAYIIYRVLLAATPDGSDYELMASVVGMVESTKAEYLRRVMTPYEDEKMGVNGDV